MSNLIYVHKISETGAVLSATLSSGSPAAVFDMTGWTVTLNVKKGSIKIIDNAACSGNSSGEVTCTINNASFASGVTVSPKDYLAEFKAVNGSTKLYWPKNKNGERTYFTFRVQSALD